MKIIASFKHYLWVAVSLLAVSCQRGDSNKWNSNLENICDNKQVTIQDYEEFKKVFSKNKKITNEPWQGQKAGEIDSVEFIKYLKSECGCTILWETINTNYHIYIDGSDLTKGYIKKEKMDMSKSMNGILVDKVTKLIEKNKTFICLLNSEGECIQQHSFNNKSQLSEYIEDKLSDELKQSNGLSSLFHKLIPKIAEKADKENVVVLASDLITSNHKDNSKNVLEFLKGIDIKNKSFYLVGYNVDFNGYFWYSNNQKTQLSNIQRPFYMLFIGQPEQIIKLKKMNFLHQESIGEFISISSINDLSINTRILQGRNNIQGVEIEKKEKNKIKIKKPTQIKFTLEVLGMENLEVLYGESYLSNQKNYQLSEPKYTIKEIRLEKENEKHKYYFIITSEEPIPTNLTVSIKINELPKWIENNSVNINDLEKEKTKTFGLYELIYNLAKNNRNMQTLFKLTIID